MEKVLNLYKKEGETPLETTENFRKENSEYEKEKMIKHGLSKKIVTVISNGVEDEAFADIENLASYLAAQKRGK